MAITTTSTVTRAEQRQMLAPPDGTPFAPADRLFAGFYGPGGTGDTVFDYGFGQAADIEAMLAASGKASGLEQVLTLPLRGATWKIEPDTGDTGQAALVQDNLGDKLGRLIDQMTTAVGYRRAFFATSWRMDGTRIVYDRLDWRPPTGCEAGFDPMTGQPKGFRQRVIPVGGIYPKQGRGEWLPGYVTVKPTRSFVYTHGSYRDPIRGVSDLDVALWCFTTRRKIEFLWFQFLENQSLPKTVVYGDSIDQAAELAADIGNLKSSGVLGLPRPNEPGAKAFDVLESSGLGAGQFFQAVQYLNSEMTASVLASFTDLPQAAVQGTGSYALSADQSEFFLASRQAVADEMADAIRTDVFAPLILMNFGPDAPVPKITIGPLSSRYVERGLTMLTSVIQSRYSNMPPEITRMLIEKTASYLGLDEVKVTEAIVKDAAQAAKDAAAQALLPQAPAGPPPKPIIEKGQYPIREIPAHVQTLSRAVEVAHELVTRAQAGEDPEAVLLELSGRSGPPLDHPQAREGRVDLAAVDGHHVAGTPFNWRHGWHPLNVATALLHRKLRAAKNLHSAGSPFADDHPGLRPLGQATARGPADMSDSELDTGMQDAIGRGDLAYLDRLGNETDRRDAARALANDAEARRIERSNALLDRMGALIDQGVPEAEAHAEVYGGSPDAYARKQAISTLRHQGYSGAGFDELAAASFQDRVRQAFDQAESDTRGLMLNRRTETANAAAGLRAGKMIDPLDLFTGNEATARKYASDELRAWWDANGRPTISEWKADLLGDTSRAQGLRARRGVMLS